MSRIIYSFFPRGQNDLDLVIAESRGITVDEVDALPLDTVELLREKIVSESPNEWGVR